MSNSLKKGAEVAVNQCLNVKKGQPVLIVTDDQSKKVAESLKKASENTGAEVIFYTLPEEIGKGEEERPLEKTPEDLKKEITEIKKESGEAAAFTIFQTDPEEIGGDETPFRVDLLMEKLLTDPNPFRVGHMPGFKEKHLSTLSEPLTEMHERAKPLIKALNWADYVHISTEKGTNLELKIEGRKAIESIGKVKEQGEFRNVPSGEVFISPVEDYGKDKFVVDGSTGFGVVENPITLSFEEGKIVDIDGNNSKVCKNYINSLKTDEEAKVIGEFGIGINSKAEIVDEMAIAEKGFNTCHIATGKNTEHGGKNESKTHQDVICKDPTVVVSKGNKEKSLLENGKIVV